MKSEFPNLTKKLYKSQFFDFHPGMVVIENGESRVISEAEAFRYSCRIPGTPLLDMAADANIGPLMRTLIQITDKAALHIDLIRSRVEVGQDVFWGKPGEHANVALVMAINHCENAPFKKHPSGIPAGRIESISGCEGSRASAEVHAAICEKMAKGE